MQNFEDVKNRDQQHELGFIRQHPTFGASLKEYRRIHGRRLKDQDDLFRELRQYRAGLNNISQEDRMNNQPRQINRAPSYDALKKQDPSTDHVELLERQSTLMVEQRAKTAEATGMSLPDIHSAGPVAVEAALKQAGYQLA